MQRTGTTVSPAPETDFDAFRDSYTDAVQEALPLRGAEAAFFSKLKAIHLLDLARRELGDPSQLDVLDVGCGIGATDGYLDHSFKNLSGVDVAEQLLEVARDANPDVSYRGYQKDEPIPHEDGRFDLTFAICVLHHVPPPEWPRFISDMGRVTRRGGLVCVIEHNPWNPLTRRVVHNCEFDRDAVLLSRPRLAKLVKGAGLTEARARYIAFMPRSVPFLEGVERGLGRLPFGAQYYVAARR